MTNHTHQPAGQATGQDTLTSWASDETYATLGEIVDAARAALDGDVLEFLDSGAGDEVTLHRNREAFARSAAPTARSPRRSSSATRPRASTSRGSSPSSAWGAASRPPPLPTASA